MIALDHEATNCCTPNNCTAFVHIKRSVNQSAWGNEQLINITGFDGFVYPRDYPMLNYHITRDPNPSRPYVYAFYVLNEASGYVVRLAIRRTATSFTATSALRAATVGPTEWCLLSTNRVFLQTVSRTYQTAPTNKARPGSIGSAEFGAPSTITATYTWPGWITATVCTALTRLRITGTSIVHGAPTRATVGVRLPR